MAGKSHKEPQEYQERMKYPEDNPHYKFGDRLKTQMKKKHLSQQDLADMLGVSIQTVRDWNQHYSFPTENNLAALCEIFAPCSADYFHGIIDEPNYDLKYITDYTGINADNIEFLHGMNINIPEYIGTLNELLKTGYFWDMVEALYGAKQAHDHADEDRQAHTLVEASQAFYNILGKIPRIASRRMPILDTIKNRPNESERR